MNNNKSNQVTYLLSLEVINSIKNIAEKLHMSEEEAAIYLLSLALDLLGTQGQCPSESDTPPPD